VQSRVFEPFFTTKSIGKGTGQGLSLVQTVIVRKHDGTVGFETTPGKGTVFRLTLPLHEADAAAGPADGGNSIGMQ
jgi:signal transduction histidine kinase